MGGCRNFNVNREQVSCFCGDLDIQAEAEFVGYDVAKSFMPLLDCHRVEANDG
jgi:hypothetical protein